MTQVHIVVRRINPALKVDFLQVGCIKDDQFSTLPLDALDHTPVPGFVEHSSISASPYINHCQIPSLVEALITYPDFSIDFFDNTLVLMFSTDLIHNESASKEEGKGH
nr:MAG TPA: hypothetical protein [Microviridae sp.]